MMPLENTETNTTSMEITDLEKGNDSSTNTDTESSSNEDDTGHDSSKVVCLTDDGSSVVLDDPPTISWSKKCVLLSLLAVVLVVAAGYGLFHGIMQGNDSATTTDSLLSENDRLLSIKDPSTFDSRHLGNDDGDQGFFEPYSTRHLEGQEVDPTIVEEPYSTRQLGQEDDNTGAQIHDK